MSVNGSYLPAQSGNRLTTKQLENLLAMVGTRQINFPDEPPVMSMGLVFLNAGEVYSLVECREEGCGWKGTKQEVAKGDKGVPKCVNGHEGSIFITKELSLGWVEVNQ